MGDDLADLGMAAAAVDPLHQRAQPLGLRDPVRSPALAQAAVINELHVEAADRRRLAEHVRLQPAGRIPQGLAAHGRIEREDEPSAPPGLGGRSEALHLGKEGVDLRTRGGCRRCAAVIRR